MREKGEKNVTCADKTAIRSMRIMISPLVSKVKPFSPWGSGAA